MNYSDEQMEADEAVSDFEKDFLTELNQKMFPSSLEQVREKKHLECQAILQQTKLFPTNDLEPMEASNNIEIPPSKLLIYEHVYLLPEEVRFNSLLRSLISYCISSRQCFFNMLLVV